MRGPAHRVHLVGGVQLRVINVMRNIIKQHKDTFLSKTLC